MCACGGGYRELLGKVLHDACQQALGGLLRAEQNQVHVLIPTQEQAFGQHANSHYTLQSSATPQTAKLLHTTLVYTQV